MFRIGLLGASRIAPPAVINPARDNPDFEVVAVGARDPARARAYAAEHGIPSVAAGYAELIARDDVDVVYNALPPAAHPEWSIAALEAGKAVLCEKPFCKTAGEAKQMVAAADRTGRPLMEAFHYRYHNVMLKAEAMVREGAFGRLTSAAAEFKGTIARTPTELRWQADQGGGGLMDLGCYPLHALRTLIGAEPTVTGATGVFEDRVDTDLSAELAFPGGLSGSIACSMVHPSFSAWLRLEGERGKLEIVNYLAPQMGCRFTTTIDGVETRQPVDGPSTYAAQLIHLGKALRGETTLLTGGADAIANMTAIEAIYAAAGRP
ncbi:MAG: Gfo/Idh/MocA family protein [Caulobacterales bacterium]